MAERVIAPKLMVPALSPEVLREQLLRPYPKVGLRFIIVALIVVGILSWSVNGTETSIPALVRGLPSVWNFITRLFPPDFEFQRGTERTFINGGEERTVALSAAEDTIRPLYHPEIDVYVGETPVAVTRSNADETFNTLRDSGAEDVRYIIRFPEGVVDLTVPLENADDVVQAALDEPLPIFIYDNGQPIPVEQRDLPQTVSLLRADGLTEIRYVVGATGTTIGYPIIFTAILETIQMAIIGTLGAVLLAIPFGLMAARNVSPHPTIYIVTRLVLNTLRAIPELIYALIFVAAVGLGPFPGVLAIIFGSVGSLSRLFAEAIEQIDPQQVLAVQATGAGGVQTFMYSVLPQAIPLLISYSLVYFEHNVRNATILGIVGAGGVGMELQTYMSLFQYDKMMGTVIVLVLAVTVIDRFSNYVRSRFI